MNAVKIIFTARKIQTKIAAKDLNIEVTRLAKILNGSVTPNVKEAEKIKQYVNFLYHPIYLFVDIPPKKIEEFLYQYFKENPVT